MSVHRQHGTDHQLQGDGILPQEFIFLRKRVKKLFLYTKGKKGGSEDLKALLTYFEETTPSNAVDEDLKEIQEIVGTIKRSKETGDRYMTLQEIIDHEKEYSYQDGMIKGIIQTCQSLNQTKDKAVEALMAQCDLTEETAAECIARYWQDKTGN